MKTLITLVIVLSALFFLYRSCTTGYDNYAYFVRVSDEAVYQATLSEDDTRIIEHGRRLKTDIVAMDKDMDLGNGPEKGTIRWYNCMGIDCDDGWQHSFRPEI